MHPRSLSNAHACLQHGTCDVLFQILITCSSLFVSTTCLNPRFESSVSISPPQKSFKNRWFFNIFVFQLHKTCRSARCTFHLFWMASGSSLNSLLATPLHPCTVLWVTLGSLWDTLGWLWDTLASLWNTWSDFGVTLASLWVHFRHMGVALGHF